MQARSLAAVLLVLAGLPHVCNQRGEGKLGPFSHHAARQPGSFPW